MRPQPDSNYAISRSRKSSHGEGLPIQPTTYFLTRDLDQHESPNVQSSRVRQPDDRGSSRRRSTMKPLGFERAAPVLVPVSLSRDSSLPDSPQSIQKSEVSSLVDDAENQAIVSSDEDEKYEGQAHFGGDSAPQLVMPSIRMPTRRPFTQKGQQLGSFRILITGCEGSGRTSLIKSIVQLCEDIVHVDPAIKLANSQRSMSETYASTRPYPRWWSDVDGSRILKRRKSGGDLVLERNVCFVDTTGSGRVDKTIAYMEQQFLRSINSINIPGTDLSNLLCGRGGSQVDLVLYLATKETIKSDIDNIRQICQLASVVPLISKADLLPAELISELKAAFEDVNAILPHLSAPLPPERLHKFALPYCISSLNGPDFDNMDASLLMSSGYVQPLLPSELTTLVDEIFDPSVVLYFRHLTAKKLVAWYNLDPKLTRPIASPSLRSFQPSTLNSPLSHSGVLVPITSEVSLNTSNSYALAKVVDHTQREDHLAQIRLCKWADELQLSLQRERERYENVARNERALWLVQRMGEEVRDGQIVPIELPADASSVVASIKGKYGGDKTRLLLPKTATYEVHDPLGLLHWQDTMRAQGWVMLQVIGSFGVIGGVTIWLAKTWGWTASLQEWVEEYGAAWSGNGS